jgi:lysophospholipase L1-like esterase
MALQVTAYAKIVFIGDSITDCSRAEDSEGIGFGYVRTIRDWLRARDPVNAPTVINRGISGNKVPDLAARWQADVIDLAPDVLSIMIGVNDVWHGLNPAWRPGVPIEAYIMTYRQILMELRGRLPACRLVLCEPTVISPPAPAQGNDALKPYVQAVHELAASFVADAIVPTHDAFRCAESQRIDIDWTTDGVHPTSTGHALIARTWLAAAELL